MALPYFLQSFSLRRTVAPVLFAVVVAGIAWVGIGPLLSGGDAPDEEEEVPVPAAPTPEPEPEVSPVPEPPRVYPTVLVANSDVPPGMLIRDEFVEWREWRLPLDPTVAAVKDVVAEAAVIGAVATRGFRDGDMITWDGILVPGHPGFISAVLTPGMVAVTVEVDRATTDANIIYPGDRVDIIMTTPAVGESAPASYTIVSDSRILAVGSTVLALGRYGRVSRDEDGEIVPVPAPDGANYTVEVMPADAERVAVAATGGRLMLAMRSINAAASDASPREPARFDHLIPAEEKPPEAVPVRVIRGARAAVDAGGNT